MTYISVSRELLQINLRTYGEEALAIRVPTLSDVEMREIGVSAETSNDRRCKADRQGVDLSRVNLRRCKSAPQAKPSSIEGNISGTVSAMGMLRQSSLAAVTNLS